MAAAYAREISVFQPEGPYHLMGHSIGGWIAYAIAQALSREGSKVGLLALPGHPRELHLALESSRGRKAGFIGDEGSAA